MLSLPPSPESILLTSRLLMKHWRRQLIHQVDHDPKKHLEYQHAPDEDNASPEGIEHNKCPSPVATIHCWLRNDRCNPVSRKCAATTKGKSRRRIKRPSGSVSPQQARNENDPFSYVAMPPRVLQSDQRLSIGFGRSRPLRRPGPL